MGSTIGKSATRLWREQIKDGRTTLSFANWITREKEKMAADGINNNLLMVDSALNDSVHAAIKDATASAIPAKPAGSTVFGINKTVFIISALLLAVGGTYLIIQIGKK